MVMVAVMRQFADQLLQALGRASKRSRVDAVEYLLLLLLGHCSAFYCCIQLRLYGARHGYLYIGKIDTLRFRNVLQGLAGFQLGLQISRTEIE